MGTHSFSEKQVDTPFVRWLLDVVKQRGWKSGRQAAFYLGVNQAAFSTWLTGANLPKGQSIERLAVSTGEPLENIVRLVANSRQSERLQQDSYVTKGVIMDTLAEQVAERTAARTSAAIVRDLAPLLYRLYPDHVPEQKWLRLTRMRIVERVEGAAMAAGGPGEGGQISRGDRHVLWEVRVRGTCMEPTIPDGATVLIDRRAAELGETVAIAVGDDVMVKRLARLKDERVLVTEGGTTVRPGEEGLVLGVVCYVPMPRGPTDLH